MSAPELGRRRVREVRESSGRLPPRAKYWFPSEGIVAASAFRLPVLFMLTLLDRESCEAQILFRLPPNLNDEIELERDEVRDPRPNDAGASIRALIG
jgi:hypothetical protein